LASLLVIAILGLTLLTLHRSLASWRAAKSVPEIKIQEDYQSRSRRTLVQLEPIQVQGEQYNGLTIGGYFSYSGRTIKQKPADIILSLTSVAKEFKYAKQRNLIAIADGETIKLGVMNRAAQQAEVSSDGRIEAVKPGKKGASKGDYALEALTINVPTTTLTKIAMSKAVKMKLGETEFDLTENHFTALLDLLDRAKQNTSASKRPRRR
jgi:hypothetical protein